ncbi:hypothetical protein NDU88_004392 [Pleurodeles waltl]|uniref:Uncharacterized protein n=1 Tax=Pleurodeles waltl TaxID=8319 RepID=A0AAV7RIN4_PLEWA|nr:hypothetical protein NDU88_004392 [Pleurodeles waltl]
MAAQHNTDAVHAGLCVIGEAGCADLLRPGVLGEVWVCLERPTLATAKGMAAAVVACSSPRKARKNGGRERNISSKPGSTKVLVRCRSLTGSQGAGTPWTHSYGRREGDSFMESAGEAQGVSGKDEGTGEDMGLLGHVDLSMAKASCSRQ